MSDSNDHLLPIHNGLLVIFGRVAHKPELEATIGHPDSFVRIATDEEAAHILSLAANQSFDVA